MKRFANVYKFSNQDTNNFISLLQKCVYPYDYMDGWEKFNNTSLRDKKNFLQSPTYARYH